MKEMKKMEDLKIKITVGDHTLHAKLKDNAATRKFCAGLPRTYPMMNLYGREMCYRMGAGSLPTPGAKNIPYSIGDISY